MSWLKTEINYLTQFAKANFVWVILAVYYALATILYFAFDWDFFLPCISKLVTGYNCPGCGLTSASLQLLQFNFIEAWHLNPLVYVVLPLGAFLIVKGYLNTRQKLQNRVK